VVTNESPHNHNRIDGDVVKEPNAVARALAKAVSPALVGTLPVEQAQVAQWQAWVKTSEQQEGFGAQAAELNQALAARSFLVGQRATLADVQVYFAMAKGVEASFPGPLGGLIHVTRWFNQIQHALRAGAFAAHDGSMLPKLLPMHAIYKPIAMPVFAKEMNGDGAKAAAGGAKQGQAPPPPSQQQGQQKEKQQQQQQQQQHQQQHQQQPAKEGGGGKGGEGGGKKAAARGEKKGGAANPNPNRGVVAEEEDLSNPNLLDIKVGVITKAWHHPESEKLWCEEIDLGEEVGGVCLCACLGGGGD
jgi:tRNA-binding EMAP/Myf-like protein